MLMHQRRHHADRQLAWRSFCCANAVARFRFRCQGRGTCCISARVFLVARRPRNFSSSPDVPGATCRGAEGRTEAPQAPSPHLTTRAGVSQVNFHSCLGAASGAKKFSRKRQKTLAGLGRGETLRVAIAMINRAAAGLHRRTGFCVPLRRVRRTLEVCARRELVLVHESQDGIGRGLGRRGRFDALSGESRPGASSLLLAGATRALHPRALALMTRFRLAFTVDDRASPCRFPLCSKCLRRVNNSAARVSIQLWPCMTSTRIDRPGIERVFAGIVSTRLSQPEMVGNRPSASKSATRTDFDAERGRRIRPFGVLASYQRCNRCLRRHFLGASAVKLAAGRGVDSHFAFARGDVARCDTQLRRLLMTNSCSLGALKSPDSIEDSSEPNWRLINAIFRRVTPRASRNFKAKLEML